MAWFVVFLVLLAVVALLLIVVWRRLHPSNEGRLGAPTTTVLVDLVADPEEVAAARQELASALEVAPDETLVYMRGTRPGPTGETRKRDDRVLDPRRSGRLMGVSGEHKGESFPVPPAGLIIGRKRGCDVVLSDPRVSSRHAWIGAVDGKFILRDLTSTNGTFLNARLTVSVTETTLRTGDTIMFGGHYGDQFRFVVI